MNMKQMEVTEKKIGENMFYIRPFPAFTAVNISGELVSTLSPLLGGVVAAVGNDNGNGNEGKGDDAEKKSKNILDADINEAMPVITSAFSGISGDKFERLMKKLLIDNKNVSVECEATDGDVKLLTYDLANEVFCGDVQDMYILCFEVIRLNFKGFFSKIGDRFGTLTGLLKTEAPGTKSMEN